MTSRASRSKGTSEEIGSHFIKIAGTAEDGEFWLAKVLSIIDDLEKDKKHVVSLSDAEDGEINLNEITVIVKKLSKVKLI